MTHKHAMQTALDALNKIKSYGNIFLYPVNGQSPYEQVCEAIDVLELEINEPNPRLVALKVVHGEICYKSTHDDQSFGMWCPVNGETNFKDGTEFCVLGDINL